MKILVLTHEYPPIGGGGGKVVKDICDGLAARGHSLQILSAQYGDLPERETPLPNLNIQRLRSCRTQAYRASLKTMTCFVLACLWRGWKKIRADKPDLIHAHFAVPAGAVAWALARLSGVPYLLTIHGGDVPGGAPQKTAKWFRYLLPFTRPIWKEAAAIISVSEQTRRFALQQYPFQIEVIPNGVDTQRLQPVSLQVNRPPHILFIGRFSPEKNAVAVPRILAQINDLPWRCSMLGDGPQMPAVRAAIKTAGLEERVNLTGWVTPQQVEDLLAHSDILLMPSLLDSMPMAGLQALSMGLALVLSDIGSCPDFINQERNGVLVPAGDEIGYAQALRVFLSDEKLLQSSRLASRAYAQRFNLATVIDAYEQAFARVLKG